jgi:lipopolysaccharide transport system permease protein
MLAYLGAIWKCRYFWLSLVKMDLRARYRGSVLGMGWSLLYPICMTTIICVAFGGLFGLDLSEFAPFLMAGLTFWGFLGTVTAGGCQSFFCGESYIRQHPAPMAIYPLRTMLGGAFHYSLGLGLVIILGGVMHGYDSPWPLFTLVPTLLLLLVFGWALAVIFAVINVRFRDTNHLTELALQILFYLTPVMYKADMLQNRGIGFLLWLNPLVPFLDLLRKPTVYCQTPDLMTYLLAFGITVVAGAAAGLALRSQERQLIFHM